MKHSNRNIFEVCYASQHFTRSLDPRSLHINRHRPLYIVDGIMLATGSAKLNRYSESPFCFFLKLMIAAIESSGLLFVNNVWSIAHAKELRQ